jgi:hypothetical protein
VVGELSRLDRRRPRRAALTEEKSRKKETTYMRGARSTTYRIGGPLSLHAGRA